MRIAIGSDHGGFNLKVFLVGVLGKDHEIVDIGVEEKRPVDYPVYADKVARLVADNRVEFGILICTTGIGMSITANKIPGVRAALVCDVERAELTRRHNDANVLCLAGGFMKNEEALDIATAFLGTPFAGNNPGEEHHKRRVNQIAILDNGGVISKEEK